MAGLGKYKKGVAFTLKSGNKPSFTQMGSSPANLNNFGIGPGGSPYKQDSDETDGKDKTIDNTPKEQGGDAETADTTWKKALKIGTTLLSGGISGVYGGRPEYPKINYGKKTKEATTTPEDGVKNNLIDQSAAVEYSQDGKMIFPDDPQHSQYKKTSNGE